MAKMKIKLVDVTGYTPTQIENYFNTNLYQSGWRIKQIVPISNKVFILAERAE